jgi:hypothetical protein
MWRSASVIYLLCLAPSFQVSSNPSPTGRVALGIETAGIRRQRLLSEGQSCTIFAVAFLARAGPERPHLADTFNSGFLCQTKATVPL